MQNNLYIITNYTSLTSPMLRCEWYCVCPGASHCACQAAVPDPRPGTDFTGSRAAGNRNGVKKTFIRLGQNLDPTRAKLIPSQASLGL